MSPLPHVRLTIQSLPATMTPSSLHFWEAASDTYPLGLLCSQYKLIPITPFWEHVGMIYFLSLKRYKQLEG